MLTFRSPSPLPVRYNEPAPEQYQHIHDVADTHENEMDEAFVSAAGASAKYSDLYDAVGTGSPTAVQQAIDLRPFFSAFSIAHGEMIEDTATIAYAMAATGQFEGAAVAGANPYAVQWASNHSALQVTAINELTREGIRQAAVSTLGADMSRADMARQIKGMIGLTPSYVTAVGNYRQRLKAQGLSKARIAELVRKQIEKYLWLRARMIERTELMLAANMGQQLLWEQAVQQGLILAGEWERFWITTPDDRLCAFCAAMDGKVTEIIGMNFEGEISGGQVVSILVPPLHPNCRCTVGIRRKR